MQRITINNQRFDLILHIYPTYFVEFSYQKQSNDPQTTVSHYFNSINPHQSCHNLCKLVFCLFGSFVISAS